MDPHIREIKTQGCITLKSNGENFKVIVLESNGTSCVRLGIDAPKNIQILRDNIKKIRRIKNE